MDDEQEGTPDPRLLVKVGEAAQRLGVSRTTLYGMLRSDTLASVAVGRCRRIAVADLDELCRQGRLLSQRASPSVPTSSAEKPRRARYSKRTPEEAEAADRRAAELLRARFLHGMRPLHSTPAIPRDSTRDMSGSALSAEEAGEQ